MACSSHPVLLKLRQRRDLDRVDVGAGGRRHGHENFKTGEVVARLTREGAHHGPPS
jgi:hypothetical protein